MKRAAWDARVRRLMRALIKSNKRDSGGACSCGAERFMSCYEGCEVDEMKHLLKVEVTDG
jgi:hypothetical protein